MNDTIINARPLGDLIRRSDKPIKRYPTGRVCEKCNAKLATDNPDPVCSPCQRPRRAW